MRTIRIKLLITLILVTVVSVTLSSSASAYKEYQVTNDPSWVSSLDGQSDLDGEPEVGGNTTPPPSGGRSYGAGRDRTEGPTTLVDKFRLYVTWMSRIWAARNWGVPF